MASNGKRLKVMMICAHEPTLDPRIRWEAEGAASRFDVTVLGFNHPGRLLPEREKINGYLVIRLKPKEVSGLHYFLQLASMMRKRISIPLVAALYFLSPALLTGEGLARFGQAATRRAARPAVAAGPEQTRIPRSLHLARRHLMARLLRI